MTALAASPAERVVLPLRLHAAERVLVVVPTYNEGDNLLRLLAVILEATDADVLVVDDDSPDGTGKLADALAELNARITVLHRAERAGLGSAYVQGFRWALGRGYEYVVQMDADFSHDPRAIPSLLAAAESHDLVIGSRYCERGAVMGWPLRRKVLSRTANRYARTLLGLKPRDGTSGFRCWRRDVLESILRRPDRPCEGFAFQPEMVHRAEQLGARVCEVPILFVDRRQGRSKMRVRELVRGAADLIRVALRGRKQLVRNRAAPAPHPCPSRPERILVLALGGIGDTVMAFAMMRRLRQMRPDAHLTALVMWPQAAELIEDLGVFNVIVQHHFQNEPWRRSFHVVRRLRRERFDLGIQAYPANRFEYNLMHFLLGVRRRIGHDYLRGSRWGYLRFLLTDRVAQTLGTHNIEENLKLLRLVAPESERGPIDSRLGPTDSRLGPLGLRYHEYADALLGAGDGSFLGIHAGSSGYKNLHGKRWPAERFAELCNRVREQYGWTPLLFGSAMDRPINEAIRNACPAARIVETPSIRHTAAVIQRCRAFVGNDSAPGHIAVALDVPTILLVGPTDPLEIGPCSGGGTAVSCHLNCTPCFRVSRKALTCKHPTPFACMAGISVDSVVREIELYRQHTIEMSGPMIAGVRSWRYPEQSTTLLTIRRKGVNSGFAKEPVS
ncbi:MAG: Undecaprenyl-phosphate 4-deoxy-4-formamido-L-arabinose transferase [Phycisphaerae bacterium]|nr:Undecaprenyl-phosphate 4-deoxy-4-formamido-L-arabinose transferase [Phycisphaerae bacterium]